MSGQRMLNDIPMIGSSRLPLLLLMLMACSLLIRADDDDAVNDISRDNNNNNNSYDNDIGMQHPVYLSEYKLRSIIEALNRQLRDLKGKFMEQVTYIYLKMKSDPNIGFEQAKTKSTPLSVGMVLMAEEFADIVVKEHIIQRRLLSGLRMAFVKFLPIVTLRKLVTRFKSYSWLRDQNQVDLRPKFKGAKEDDYIQLYTLIELRARIRASDDVVTLTSDNMKRILNTIKRYLVEQNHEQGVRTSRKNDELQSMAQYASKILQFYLHQVIGTQQELNRRYENEIDEAKKLLRFIGGKEKFVKFIDRIIDIEALDVDLNQAATNLDLPPTINQVMIDDAENKWIPKKMIQNMNEDRILLMRNRNTIKHLIKLEPDRADIDLATMCANVDSYINNHLLAD